MTRKNALILAATAVLAFGSVGWWILHRGTSSTSTGQTVNATIDNLLATGVRLLELPTTMLLAFAAILGAALAILVARFAMASRRVTVLRVVLPSLAAIIVFGLALSVDRNLHRMQGEVHSLRDKMHEQQMAMIDMLNSRGPAAPASPEKVITVATPVANMLAAQPRPAAPQTISPGEASTPVKTVVASNRDVPMFDVDKVPRTLTSY